MEQDMIGHITVEGIDGGLHPAVDGQCRILRVVVL